MTGHPKLWTIGLVAAALVALILLASGLSSLELSPGQGFTLGGSQPVFGEGPVPDIPIFNGIWRLFIAAMLWVVGPIFVVAMIVSADLRRRIFRRALNLLVWLLVAYGAVRALQGLRHSESSTDRAGATSIAPLRSPPLFITHPPQWFIAFVGLTIASMLVGGIWLIRRRARIEEAPLELLQQEAEAALESLRSGGDLKDVVMRCYLEMSRVLRERRGVARSRDMTPREFEQRLAAAGLRDEHIRRLTHLFESVRYGGHSPGDVEQREAVACLSAIVQFCEPAA